VLPEAQAISRGSASAPRFFFKLSGDCAGSGAMISR
jgi:hypothetical protein